MRASGIAIISLFASSAIAAPSNPLSSRDPDTFQIHVHNNCAFTKQFALYQITSSFQMLRRSQPVNIPSKGSHIIPAPFKGTGMRLSGHAEWGTDKQWNPQALFEFGYSEYAGQTGTAYDISMMEKGDSDIGLGVYPIGGGCSSKTCFPWDCPLSQGWTNQGQIDDGSPADTVCYKGKTDFKVVFCP